jgi:uncharacterized membrane protein
MTFLLVLGFAAIVVLWNEVAKLRRRIEMLEDVATFHAPVEPVREPEPVRVAAVVRRAAMPAPSPEPLVEAAPVPEPVTRPKLPPVDPEPQLPKPDPQRGGGFEEVFGRKLPIWAGGATLAVAGFFVVKYSIDAGLLSPAIRVVLGFLFGFGLIGGAEVTHRLRDRVRDPRVPQALAGAGVATLYAAILVAANLYGLVGSTAAFIGLAVVTVLAGLLSLRFGPASAVLGLVGGLAAPALVGAGPPNMPLLATYLALAVGGLCALGRTQRWWWLGAAALVGGFGWGLTLILAGVLDVTAALSLGAYTLLIGIGLPLLLTGGPSATLRWAGALAGCAQMAAIVATGDFTPLNWGLYGLISAAAVWLSRKDQRLADVPLPALIVALMLAVAWPEPQAGMLAAVISGIALIFGLPALQRLWRDGGRITDAVQIAAISAAVPLIPLMQLVSPGSARFAPLAVLGGVIAGGAAALGWRRPRDDARFALLTATAAALLALAAGLALPEWMLAPAIALIAAGLLLLAIRAADVRLERASWAFGLGSIFFLLLTDSGWEDFARTADLAGGQPLWTSATRWAVMGGSALLFALRGRADIRPVAQVLAVLLGYGAAAQLVPGAWLCLVPAAALPTLAWTRRGRPIEPALATAALLALAWAALPLAQWSGVGLGALAGYPAYVGNLPSWTEALIRLAAPALALALAITLRLRPLLPSEVERRGYSVGEAPHDHIMGERTWLVLKLAAAVVGTVSLHILYKQLFALNDHAAFVSRAMAERTVWELLFAGIAVAAWRFGRRDLATAAGGLSLAHFTWFTLLVHNPLWAEQSVGPWLVPAYGTAAALLWAAGKLDLRPELARARQWGLMLLILVFGLSALRQIFHGSLLSAGDLSQAEDIARSVLAIAAAVGFLIWGIRHSHRDWRITSLVLMLGAVAKVFLADAAGLDGLLRIASFAALGFSLIGVGWLYSRYLPEGRAT